MTTDKDAATPEHVDEPKPNDQEIRLRAKKRSWVCPGAGFAMVGDAPLATVTFAASLFSLPAVAWLAFQPNALSAWTTVALIGIATILWLIEQLAVKKATIRTPKPRFLVGGFVVSGCVILGAAILVFVLFLTSFGSLRMVGPGMSPTLEEAERLIYHKHVDSRYVKRGAVILFENADDSAWGEPGWLVISRIIAGPGDKLSVRNGIYVVNDSDGPEVGETGEHRLAIDVPSVPKTLTVPEDCYFIAQDFPARGLDSRVLSWVRADSIVGSRLWYLSVPRAFKAVE